MPTYDPTQHEDEREERAVAMAKMREGFREEREECMPIALMSSRCGNWLRLYDDDHEDATFTIDGDFTINDLRFIIKWWEGKQ